VAQAVEPIAEGPGDRAAPVGAPRQKGELEPLAVTAERVQTHLPKEEAVYPGRFMLGYLLIVLFFGALLAAVAIAWSQRASDGGDAASNWSSFKPTAETEEQRTREISRYIATRYQTTGGEQIVRVLGGPPAVQNTPVTELHVRDGSAQETISADKALLFILCGTGTDCALPAADSSDAHQRLVRRESLELALYTMQYNDVDPVVVLLPPDLQGNPGGALLFRRDEMKAHLDLPLERTLPTASPPTATGIGELEGATVDYLTLTRRFAYSFQSAPDGTARMVLNPDRPAS
jgi:hypothetical protein